MVNRHFGNFADVWKHLVLCEVLSYDRPASYAETHAGSAANPMVDDAERQFGVLRFLEVASDHEVLATSRYRGLLHEHGDARAYHPGSALLAMTALGAELEYLFCDLDPASVADLRAWANRCSSAHCEVREADGMTETAAWMTDAHGPLLVHVDPFDPDARSSGGLSAVELAAQVAEQGHTLVYWYGYDKPKEAAWAIDRIGQQTRTRLWCGDVVVLDHAGAGRTDGDLGEATTPGTGSGVVLANVAPATHAACTAIGQALAAAYAGAVLPTGDRGNVRFTVHESG